MAIAPRPTWLFAPLLASSVLLAAGGAWAQYIDLPGTQPNGLADGTPLDNARSCGVTCHYSRDPSTPSTMPYDGWIGSMMGNTLRDPLFLAALTVAEQDHAGVGDYCLRCHTPPGFVGGRTRSSPTAALGSDLQAPDRDGVTCDSCHRMLPTSAISNGQYMYSDTEVRFGPYPTTESIRHPSMLSPWISSSEQCGTCHEVTNPLQPLRRADGTDTGQRYPLDTTYSEWLHSAYSVDGAEGAATCQDCHMPDSTTNGYVSTEMSAMLRTNPSHHDFSGANAWALRVLATLRTDVTSGEFYDPDTVPLYEAGALRAEASLRRAVSVEIREPPAATADPGAHLTVTARITNLSGHRVPTGETDGRRVWLELAVVDRFNTEHVLSGAYDTVQAHLDETDPQLKLYQAVPGRAGMGAEFHTALHDTMVRDTRLPPRGYRPPPGNEPVGVDYSGGADGALRHWDDATYTFTMPADVHGPVSVRVRARYQVTSREYIESLAHDNHTDDRGATLLRLYEASGRAAPTNMAEASAMVMVSGDYPADAGVGDAGAGDGGAGDAGRTDGGAGDAGRTDGGAGDAGRADGGARDAGLDAGASAQLTAGGCATAPGDHGGHRGLAGLVTVGVALATAARSRRRRRA